MKVCVMTPRAEVLAGARRAGVEAVPVGAAADVERLPLDGGEAVVVGDPFDAVGVARALLAHGVRPGRDDVVCVGLGDDSSQVAAVVNDTLRLGGGRYPAFTALETMRDKHRLRQLLTPRSPLSGRFALASGVDELRSMLGGYPGGVVVKPVDGAGSRGVLRVPPGEEPDELALPAAPFLVEEFFEGPEFSVEMVTWDGVHHPLVVTEKTLGGTTGLVETGQRQPARLSPEETARLFAAAGEVLTVAGHRYGISHSEFILAAGQPKLVEAHGRVGGDGIADLMAYSLGASAFEILFGAYAADGPRVPEPTGAQAAVAFVDLRGWHDTDEAWLDAVGRVDGVVRADVLLDRARRGGIRASSDRHASVMIAGAPVDSVLQKIEALEAQ